MSNARARWRNRLSAMGCIVGRRHGGCAGPINLHHIATGSGQRYDYGLVPLCEAHHDPNRTGSGFHGMGKQFLKIYRVPGETEWGLYVWLLEDLAKI